MPKEYSENPAPNAAKSATFFTMILTLMTKLDQTLSDGLRLYQLAVVVFA